MIAIQHTESWILSKLKAYLPKQHGLILWFRNRAGRLEVTSIVSNDQSKAEALEVFRAATPLISGERAQQRFYKSPRVTPGVSPSEVLITTAAVRHYGKYDYVRIWSRGGLAGELVVEAGDGERLAALLQLRGSTNGKQTNAL